MLVSTPAVAIDLPLAVLDVEVTRELQGRDTGVLQHTHALVILGERKGDRQLGLRHGHAKDQVDDGVAVLFARKERAEDRLDVGRPCCENRALQKRRCHPWSQQTGYLWQIRFRRLLLALSHRNGRHDDDGRLAAASRLAGLVVCGHGFDDGLHGQLPRP